MENQQLFEKLSEKYPFLTVIRYADEEHVGIIQNRDTTITSLYDFGSLPSDELKALFLELGEVWWWESNRSIPINIFLRQEWVVFKPFTKTFVNKNLEILSGPATSLSDIVHRKRKRKSFTLVKKVD